MQGFFHSSGVLADSAFQNQSLKSVRKVAGPKSSSALIWKTYIQSFPTACSILFSSVAALLGSPGQANYSASNAVLDALSDFQQSMGTKTVSIQWGAWAEGGMAVASEQTKLAVERMGMQMVQPRDGMCALSSILELGSTSISTLAAVPFVWDIFLGRLFEVPQMFVEYSTFWEPPSDTKSQIVTSKKERSKPQKKARRKLATKTLGLPSMEPLIQDAVKSVLGRAIEVDVPLMEAGLDSLGTVELKNALESLCGSELPATLVFDYPTVSALAAHLSVLVAPSKEEKDVGYYSDGISVPSPKAKLPVSKTTVNLDVEVQNAVKSVIGKNVDPEEPLMAAGLDSLGTVELKNALEGICGASLPSTLVFDYPTVSALSAYLSNQLTISETDSIFSSRGSEMADSDHNLMMPYQQVPAVIISLFSTKVPDYFDGLFPVDCSRHVPLNRWDVEIQSELCGGLPVHFGVFLKNVDKFDSQLVGISESESSLVDPQQRLLLETVADLALSKDADLRDDSIRSKWGTFVVSG